MTRMTPEQKAISYLSEGKVKVHEHSLEHGRCEVEVYGTASDPYVVRFAGVTWHCTCPAKTERCAHIIAVKLISSLTTAEWVLRPQEKSVIDSILGIDR
jgi:uncharacterized Zn finger protein